jgi:tetratricopeptide (TPR) repeat protein
MDVAQQFELGNRLAAQGKFAEAERCYRRILATQPQLPEVHCNLGNALMDQGKLEPAVESYRRALALRPGFAQANANLGHALQAQGNLADAVACYERALALDPAMPDAHVALGNALKNLGQPDKAVAHYRRALKLAPRFAPAHTNLASVLVDLNRPEEALAHAREALELEPELPEALSNRGRALMALGRVAEADASFKAALARRAGSVTEARTRFTYGLLRLLQGDYQAGLPLFEGRFERGVLAPVYDALSQRAAQYARARRWQGENLRGKTLLVWTEQGLGDSLMMLRYLPLLKARGAGRVIVQASAPLMRIAQTASGVDAVLPFERPIAEPFDWHCPLMSLPLAFGTRLDAIPRDVPYLFAPPELTQRWRERVAALPAPRVGIAWAGDPRNPSDALRSLKRADLFPLIQCEAASFVSLQKGDAARELARAPRPVADWMDECDDLLDTAALVSELDLVISVDSAVAHLAGALGKRVWLLNRYESEWRWLAGREDSPWYPTMTIFRQHARGDWGEVVSRIVKALRKPRSPDLSSP